ncbi:hypothetical protein [Campylobacter sputorum]|uniref:hypothetical protein n=1 Tax=Campylobacter sputorum TaxID=206 RepID=UPI000B78DF65|nr:hypothetical protein [Campylobacter sputorum]ASM37014.1 hypothetical protein CSF_1150 [Campylobacter sputorum bv. faecalis CCUG 20703]
MVSQTFKDSVKKRDIDAVRSVMFVVFSGRPSSFEIKEYLDYCFDNGISRDELFETHDGSELNDNASAWDNDYWHKMVAETKYNFSSQRVAHLIKVADCLYVKKEKISSKTNHNKLLGYIVVGAIAAIIAFVLLGA